MTEVEMTAAVHGVMASEFRDKRYAGPALFVDLRDAECETRLWTQKDLIVRAGRSLPDGIGVHGTVTGVFSFEGQPDHGLFEARVEKLDLERGLFGGHFLWLSEHGQKLLALMAKGHDPQKPDERPMMKIAFTRSTINWSFSGFMLSDYRGDLTDGARLRGMIWMDKPEDPGLFAGHAVRVDKDRHTLSVKFDGLSPNTFALLEAVIKKGGRRNAPAREG
jgi:hypothetical protein